MSKIEVDAITQQSGSTLTVGGGASKTVVADATTVTLGRCGGTVALASGATQSGFGRTGTVDWQTGSIKTTTFTADNGEGYFCNTTSGGFTVNLPAGSAGAIVSLQDYNNTFDTDALTVTPNGSEKINGGSGSLGLTTQGQGITLVYIDSTVGWRSVQDNTFDAIGSNHVAATGGTETTCGDFKIHTFTGPGTFQVTSAGSPLGSNTLEYLVVAGGGGGGGGCSGGGAGAGGFRFASPSIAPLTYPAKPLAAPAALSATASSFPITIGAGGGAGPGGTAGSNSIFSTITSAGGGGGGLPSPGGRCGGSGGAPAGNGNTPPVSPAQGTNGGSYYDSGGARKGMGGGGGAIQAGQTGTSSPSNVGFGGEGGGLPTAFGSNGVPCGSFRYYAGGGGGGWEQGGTISTGGKGGGGRGGGCNPAVCAQNGTANSGGGGGGEGYPGPVRGPAGSGGSGIVIIRYKFQ